MSRPAPKATAAQGDAPRRAVRARLVALTGFMVLAGLGARAFWLGRRPVPHQEKGLSVLLVTVDTLRADAIGAYGQVDAGTPWMDRLAAATWP